MGEQGTSRLEQLPDFLFGKLWSALGEVCGSKAEAQLSRAAFYSTCRAVRESPEVQESIGCLELWLDDQASLQEPELFEDKREFRHLHLTANADVFERLYEHLHRLGDVLRMLQEHVVQMQWEGCGPPHDALRFKHLAQLAVVCPNIGRLRLSLLELPGSPNDLSALSLLRDLKVLELESCFLYESDSDQPSGGGDSAGSVTGDGTAACAAPPSPAAALTQQLGGMTGLRELRLNLRGSQTGDPAHLGLAPLSALQQLRRLALYNAELDPRGLLHVGAGCKRLVQLVLRDVLVSPGIVAAGVAGPKEAGLWAAPPSAYAAAAAAAGAAPAAVAAWAGGSAGAGTSQADGSEVEGVLWPSLRELEVRGMEPGHAAAVLQTVRAAPALRRVVALQLDVRKGSVESSPTALRLLAHHAARIGAPVPRLDLCTSGTGAGGGDRDGEGAGGQAPGQQGAGGPAGLLLRDTAPVAALLAALAPFRRGQLGSLSMCSIACQAEDVAALASAVPDLPDLALREVSGVHGLPAGFEAVARLPCLNRLHLVSSAMAPNEAILQLCELAQGHLERRGRRLILQLTDFPSRESPHRLQALRALWAARCTALGLGASTVSIV